MNLKIFPSLLLLLTSSILFNVAFTAEPYSQVNTMGETEPLSNRIYNTIYYITWPIWYPIVFVLRTIYMICSTPFILLFGRSKATTGASAGLETLLQGYLHLLEITTQNKANLFLMIATDLIQSMATKSFDEISKAFKDVEGYSYLIKTEPCIKFLKAVPSNEISAMYETEIEVYITYNYVFNPEKGVLSLDLDCPIAKTKVVERAVQI